MTQEGCHNPQTPPSICHCAYQLILMIFTTHIHSLLPNQNTEYLTKPTQSKFP